MIELAAVAYVAIGGACVFFGLLLISNMTIKKIKEYF